MELRFPVSDEPLGVRTELVSPNLRRSCRTRPGLADQLIYRLGTMRCFFIAFCTSCSLACSPSTTATPPASSLQGLRACRVLLSWFGRHWATPVSLGPAHVLSQPATEDPSPSRAPGVCVKRGWPAHTAHLLGLLGLYASPFWPGSWLPDDQMDCSLGQRPGTQ